jgi:hypothetical protein
VIGREVRKDGRAIINHAQFKKKDILEKGKGMSGEWADPRENQRDGLRGEMTKKGDRNMKNFGAE